MKPLPSHARALRSHRFQVGVYGEKNERGGRLPLCEDARFLRFDDAKDWVDREWPDAPFVSIVHYSARDGWQAHRAASRKDGEWSSP